MNICPVVLTICEERFIRQCLAPLAACFPVVIVADTGSTDNNLAEIDKVPNVHLLQPGRLSMRELGLFRGEMAQIAKKYYGASHVIQIDGDEIYNQRYLKFILDNPMPDTAQAGYTTGVELAELPNGEIWRYDTDFNRCAVFSVDSKWRGEWPFESPEAWDPDHPETQYHWPRTERWQNFYHMHHLVRSSRDADVNDRMKYKNKFSLQTKDELKPVEKLLGSWAEYEDVK